MSHERKALLIWLATMTLFVVTVLAATTLYPMAGGVPRSARDPAAPAPPPMEVGPWRLVE
jgi:hypothetical protein